MHLTVGAPRASCYAPPAGDAQRWADRRRAAQVWYRITPIIVLLLLGLSLDGSTACVDWKAMGKFADVEHATVVFEGIVERIDPGDVATCAPERVVFTVERTWKGQSATEYTLLQGNGGHVWETAPDGRRWYRGCPIWSEADRFTAVGARYIVFAVGSPDALGAMGCGTSKQPTRRERKRLDRWKSRESRPM
jgi:hypothetical protein